MTLATKINPPLGEVLSLFGAGNIIKPLHARIVMLQAVRSEVVGYYVNGDMIAAAMFYPQAPERAGEDLRELAFACKPALSMHLRAFFRLAESTRAALANNGPVRVRALVSQSHRPGKRLARLCGMRHVGAAGEFEVWEFYGKPP